jgi:hypothetical protein
MIQQPDKVTFYYSGNGDIRHVRLNEPHPAHVTPSWYGVSVGHYEGDTLVIDTVGQKTDRPYAMLDLFGTPYTKSLHIVERYRLHNYDDVKDAIERNIKENWPVQWRCLQPAPWQVPATALDDRRRRRLHDSLDRNHDICARA